MLKKRLLLLVVVFALVAAACGDDSATTTGAPTPPPATDAPTPTPDPGTPEPPPDAPDAPAGPTLPDLGGRTVTVGVENAYIPFNYIPVGTTEGIGWDYDVWREICRLLNCTAEFAESAWPGVIQLVADDQLDTAADGISITEERALIVDYSNAYMTTEQMFIIGLADDRYATAADLIADGTAIVATQVGTTNEALANTLVGADRVQAFAAFGDAIQALITGDVDAVIIDNAAGLGYIGANKDDVKLIDDGLQSDPLGFIYPIGSDLVDPVNQALAFMAESGFLDEVGMVYFGAAFDVSYDDLVFPTYLPDLGGRTVTVGVENAYIPFNYIPVGTTEGIGWDYDVWREICRLLNCTAEFAESAWPGVIQLVADDQLDTAADGISITEERALIVDYSNAYMTTEQMFIIGLADDRYATAADLIADGTAIVATQVGTTNEALANTLVGADRVQAFAAFGDAIQALITGDVDAVIIDNAAGLGYIGANKDDVKLIDDGLRSDPLGFIYPIGSDLVDPVNQALAFMAESGFLDEVGMVYFGAAFDVSYDDLVFPTYEE